MGADELAEVWKNNSVFVYEYDHTGLRTAKTVDGVTTSMVTDGMYVVAEYVGANSTYYYRGMNLIGYMSDNEIVYYRFNAHGDVVALVDGFGREIKTYSYDAFGKQEDDGNEWLWRVLGVYEEDTNPFRYCAEYYDEETGFIYLRARYYSPDLQRFISEDPIRDGNNWYSYCLNNPINWIDFNGKDPIPKWALNIKYFNATDSDYETALKVAQKGTSKEWRGFAGYTVEYAIEMAQKEDTAFNYKWTGEHVTKSFKSKVIAVAEKLNVEPDDLMAVMAFESALRPDIVNKSGYVGLIQFGSLAADELGITKEELVKMSAVEQMDYVYKHLSSKLKNVENPTLSDLYMAILAPAKVGLPDTAAVYSLSDSPKSYNANKPLDLNGDGIITKGEATEFVIKRRETYEKKA